MKHCVVVDGFQICKGQEWVSCVVDEAILNVNTSDPIMVLLVLFIPQMPAIGLNIARSQLLEKKLKKSTSNFLLPLMEDLEWIFSNGCETYYNYLFYCIHPQSISDQGNMAIIQAMLMLVTSHHSTQ